jgi:hypothetical protein
VAAALSSSCAGTVPVWNGRLYFGDSAREGLSRTGVDPDFISIRDPRVNDYVAMSRADFKSWIATYIGGCEKWKGRPGTVMVQPVVLEQLMRGERTLADLKPSEYFVVPK